MTYAIITESTGGTMDIFRRVNEQLPDQQPEGLLMRVAGESGRGLAVFTVWRSKEDANRFFAEHHLPTLTRVLGGPPPRPDVMIELDTPDVLVTDPVT
jgi:hypothetical protein